MHEKKNSLLRIIRTQSSLQPKHVGITQGWQGEGAGTAQT